MELAYFSLFVNSSLYLDYIIATVVVFVMLFLKQARIRKKLKFLILSLIFCFITTKFLRFIIMMVLGMSLSNETLANLGYFGFIIPKALVVTFGSILTSIFIIKFLEK